MLSSLSIVICFIIGWILRTPNPSISWFLIGVLMGAVGETAALLIRRKILTQFFIAIQILLAIIAVFTGKLIPNLLGLVAGTYLPYSLWIIIYQLVHKKVLSWDDIQDLHGTRQKMRTSS